jgi:hypothetical protein
VTLHYATQQCTTGATVNIADLAVCMKFFQSIHREGFVHACICWNHTAEKERRETGDVNNLYKSKQLQK